MATQKIFLHWVKQGRKGATANETLALKLTPAQQAARREVLDAMDRFEQVLQEGTKAVS